MVTDTGGKTDSALAQVEKDLHERMRKARNKDKTIAISGQEYKIASDLALKGYAVKRYGSPSYSWFEALPRPRRLKRRQSGYGCRMPWWMALASRRPRSRSRANPGGRPRFVYLSIYTRRSRLLKMAAFIGGDFVCLTNAKGSASRGYTLFGGSPRKPRRHGGLFRSSRLTCRPARIGRRDLRHFGRPSKSLPSPAWSSSSAMSSITTPMREPSSTPIAGQTANPQSGMGLPISCWRAVLRGICERPHGPRKPPD